MQVNEILHMNGFGIFVWPAYFITFFVFFVNFYLTYHEQKKTNKTLKNVLLSNSDDQYNECQT